MIDRKEIGHIADISFLSFSDEALGAFSAEFEKIVAMFDKLSELDTGDVRLGFDASGASVTSLRPDIVEPSYERERLLENAPESAAGCVRIPGGEQ